MAFNGADFFGNITGRFNEVTDRVSRGLGNIAGDRLEQAVTFGQEMAAGIGRHPAVSGWANKIRSSSPQSLMLPGGILMQGYMDYNRYRSEGSGTLGALLKSGASTTAWMYAPAWMAAATIGKDIVKGTADAMYTASVRYMEESKNPFENAADLTAFGMQSQRAALARVNALTSASSGDQVLGNEAAILHQYYRGFYG